MAIAVTATAIATTAADTQHAAIMNEMLSAMGTGKTVETIATEGKWRGECLIDQGIVGSIFESLFCCFRRTANFVG